MSPGGATQQPVSNTAGLALAARIAETPFLPEPQDSFARLEAWLSGLDDATAAQALRADVLAAMAEVDATLAALGPAGFLGRASVWTRDAPLGAVRALVHTWLILDFFGASLNQRQDLLLRHANGACLGKLALFLFVLNGIFDLH